MINTPALAWLLAVLAASSAAFFTSRLVAGLSIERAAPARVAEMLDEGRASLIDRLGERLCALANLPLVRIRRNLALARLLDQTSHATSSAGGVLLRSLLAGAAALALVALSGMGPIFYLAVPLAGCLPLMRLRSESAEAEKTIGRLLPESATVIACEMAAGANPEQALARMAGLPGPLGALLREAVGRARATARPAFSRGASRGVVEEILASYAVPGLSRFALQLDRVASKGVEGPRVMGEVARALGREYKSQLQRASATLDNQLLLPMTVFFFFPFLLAILLPLFVALLGAFQ